MGKLINLSMIAICMFAGQGSCGEVKKTINGKEVQTLTSTLANEFQKNDNRYGEFDWSATIHGKYLVWKSVRVSNDCPTKDFLDTERTGVLDLCSIKNDGDLVVRTFEGGESLDFSYKDSFGLPPTIRTDRLDFPIADYNDIISLFNSDEAIAVNYTFCSGENSLSFYRNLSLRMSNASNAARTINKIAQEVCEEK